MLNLGTKNKNEPVKARVLRDMLIGGEQAEVGEIVELKPHDFKYLANLGRVELYVAPAKKESK